jgi:uncharacterized protein YcnI
MLRRLVLVLAVTVAGLGAAAPAAAHIDPDPKRAQAGSRLTVGFTVEHGCDGSPTVQLDMRLPDGVTDAVAEPVDGWDGSIDGDVITFVGGPLPDDVEATFDITMALPPTPDTTIYFPFVQRCEEGEIRWIGIPAEPGDELDEPAPAMELLGPIATTPPNTAPAPPTTGPDAAPATSAPESAAPSTEPPATDVTETTTIDTTDITTADAVAVADDGTDGSSNTGTIMFIVSIGAVALVAGLAWARSRSGRDPAPTA